jgi:hypothetical protein
MEVAVRRPGGGFNSSKNGRGLDSEQSDAHISLRGGPDLENRTS